MVFPLPAGTLLLYGEGPYFSRIFAGTFPFKAIHCIPLKNNPIMKILSIEDIDYNDDDGDCEDDDDDDKVYGDHKY